MSSYLEKHYSVTFTPDRTVHICDSCTRSVKSLDTKKTQLQEAEEKFRKVRQPGSYIAKKIRMTPSKRQDSTKKLRVLSSPLQKKVQTASSKDKV